MARRARLVRADRSPAGASGTPSGFVEVHRCRDQGEALVVRGLLQTEGIQVLLRSHVAQSVHPFSVGDQGQIIVLVPAGDADHARRVLDRPR